MKSTSLHLRLALPSHIYVVGVRFELLDKNVLLGFPRRLKRSFVFFGFGGVVVKSPVNVSSYLP